jgi:hypothetical protein
MSGGPASRLLVTFVTLVALCALLPASSAAATVETYDQFTQMSRNASGAYYNDGNIKEKLGSWNWAPGQPGWRGISWNRPEYREWFGISADGNWTVIDGWRDNGTYYTQRVTSESYGRSDCTGMTPFKFTDGRQHYARRIAGAAYCLLARGTIVEGSTGVVVNFTHRQQYSAPFTCSNRFYTNQRCISQHEQWSDDNRSAFGLKLDRTVYFAKGKGTMFWSRNGSWVVSGRDYR